jgi:hypothetical protein
MRTPKMLLAEVPNGTRTCWRAPDQRFNAAAAACKVEVLLSIHLDQNGSVKIAMQIFELGASHSRGLIGSRCQRGSTMIRKESGF